MITIKFGSNGNQVEATTDSVGEAAALLSQITKIAPAASTSEAPKQKAAKKVRHNRPTRAWKRWTMDEVQTLFDHRNENPTQLFSLPVLAGRGRKSIIDMQRYMRNPSRLSYAPSGFRTVAERVLANAGSSVPSTGLLD